MVRVDRTRDGWVGERESAALPLMMTDMDDTRALVDVPV
jgi:hypothetical protein